MIDPNRRPPKDSPWHDVWENAYDNMAYIKQLSRKGYPKQMVLMLGVAHAKAGIERMKEDLVRRKLAENGKSFDNY